MADQIPSPRVRTFRPLAAVREEPPGPGYEVKALAGSGAAEIYLYDEIGGWWGVDPSAFVRDLMAIDADAIDLHIHSPGGAGYDGMAIYQALRNHKARITVYVDGLAASAAAFIAMAGDRRIIAPHATMMIHEPFGLCIGPAEDMAAAEKMLNKLADNMASLHARRAGGDVADWRDVMRAETWFSADEAVAAGLMHAVQEDAEKGASDDRAQARWDLGAVFAYASRDQAPPPRIPAACAKAFPKHSSGTSDGSWDGPANEKRLPSPMPLATARKAYGWYDADKVDDGEITKADARFIHHEVSADGTPGSANVTACRTGIGVLNGGRGGTTIPDDDRQGVWNHLAAHMRAAGEEPPPLNDSADESAHMPPAAEPDPSTTEEDRVSTLNAEVRQWLGLADDPDDTAIAAAVKARQDEHDTMTAKLADLEAKATAAQAEVAEKAKASADLEEKVAQLTEKVTEQGEALAAINKDKAAAEKAAVIDAAEKAGKFVAADREKWSARYDKSPEVTAEVLAAIPANSAVPVAAVGHTGPAEPTGDDDADWAKFERELYGPADATTSNKGA